MPKIVICCKVCMMNDVWCSVRPRQSALFLTLFVPSLSHAISFLSLLRYISFPPVTLRNNLCLAVCDYYMSFLYFSFFFLIFLRCTTFAELELFSPRADRGRIIYQSEPCGEESRSCWWCEKVAPLQLKALPYPAKAPICLQYSTQEHTFTPLVRDSLNTYLVPTWSSNIFWGGLSFDAKAAGLEGLTRKL